MNKRCAYEVYKKCKSNDIVGLEKKFAELDRVVQPERYFRQFTEIHAAPPEADLSCLALMRSCRTGAVREWGRPVGHKHDNIRSLCGGSLRICADTAVPRTKLEAIGLARAVFRKLAPRYILISP